MSFVEFQMFVSFQYMYILPEHLWMNRHPNELRCGKQYPRRSLYVDIFTPKSNHSDVLHLLAGLIYVGDYLDQIVFELVLCNHKY